MKQALIGYRGSTVHARVVQYIWDLVRRIYAEGGNRIPNELEIAKRLGVSRGTVRKAISELVEDNFLYRVKHKGTFLNTQRVSFLLGAQKIAVIIFQFCDIPI